MRVLVVEVYSDSGSVSLAAHSYFAEVDGHSDSEVVGEVAVAGSASVAILVGFELLVDSAEVACCPGSYCLGNLSSCGS